MLVWMALLLTLLASAGWIAAGALALTRDTSVAQLVAGVKPHESELRLNL